MKPLLIISLILNVVLLTAMLIPSGQESDYQGRVIKVPVSSTAGSSRSLIETETALINARADIADLQETIGEYEQMVAELKHELTEAEEVMRQMENGLLPPLVIPTDKRSLGETVGRMQRKFIELKEAFPERPPGDTEAYEIYVGMLDEALREFAPILLNVEQLDTLAIGSEGFDEYVAGSLTSTFGLKGDAAKQVKDIVFYAHVEAETALLDLLNGGDRDRFSKVQETISRQAATRIREMLSPDQQVLFDKYFDEDYFLYESEPKVFADDL